jgi:hypothetical protein
VPTINYKRHFSLGVENHQGEITALAHNETHRNVLVGWDAATGDMVVNIQEARVSETILRGKEAEAWLAAATGHAKSLGASGEPSTPAARSRHAGLMTNGTGPADPPESTAEYSPASPAVTRAPRIPSAAKHQSADSLPGVSR